MKMPSFRRILLFLVYLGSCAALVATGWKLIPPYFERKLNVSASDYHLPHGSVRFESLKPPSAIEVFDAKGRLLGYSYGDKLRFYRPLSEIDPKLTQYVVLLEDAKFWGHEGFDLDEIKNSITRNLESGHLKRGGSTITQQLAKNLFLDKRKSFARKLYEIPWAMRLEKDLSKKQILELYMNVIEWGPGLHGAEAAARHYFDRPARELTEGQAMYLALIVPNPPRFDLLGHPRVRDFIEKKKRDFVHRLVGEKKIPPSDRESFLAADFGFAPLARATRAFPLFHEGNYLGNRSSKTLAWLSSWKAIENGTRPFVKGKRRVSLTLDRDLQFALEQAPLTPSPGEAAHFAVIRRDGAIRALRWLEKGKTIDPSALPGAVPADAVVPMPAAAPALESLPAIAWKEIVINN